jgi:hypothetical protein
MRQFNRALLCLWLCLVLAVGLTAAQDTTPTPTPTATPHPQPLRATVEVESVNVRYAPSVEAEIGGGLFRDEVVEVMGRNLDGLWFEVRRIGRMQNLGWVLARYFDYDFDAERLPLTDLTTGLIGDDALEADTGFAVYFKFEAILRDGPSLNADPLLTIPIEAVLPVIEYTNNEDSDWYRVNYLGVTGWVIAFVARKPYNFDSIPFYTIPGANTLTGLIIIPPELQLAQVQRIRDYAINARGVADQLANLWASVLEGKTMPCEPPPFVVEYQYTLQDARELPELQRFVPLLRPAVQSLNDSIDLLYTCGSFDLDVVNAAQAAAINARVMFDGAIFTMRDIERIISGN